MIPCATYRVQFSKDFTFSDAAAIAPYLAELGISHLYASPYLQARPGSKHGYDITNHNALNCELGGDQGFQGMVSAFREHGLEHILDYVPNHMGVGGSDNPFWLDVLEWGRHSRYARWFDIDWDSHSEYLKDKLIVPFLADQYGAELKKGNLELKFDEKQGSFSVWLYGTHKLPVRPPSYNEILRSDSLQLKDFAQQFASVEEVWPDGQTRAAELKAQLAQAVSTDSSMNNALQTALEHFRGEPCNIASWDKLNALIHNQHWRPTHFRVASDDINYRRFFNINELAGIRMELPEVFEHTHQLVLRLLNNGDLQGLRIDHIDGLCDPKAYLERLRARVNRPFYVVVEKILGRYEGLREDWPVHGTTGYEFCSELTALLVDPKAENILTNFYWEFTGEIERFAEIVRECKIRIMENELRSELETLSRDAVQVARQDPCTTDFTRNILRRALKEVIACFPVYRTYVDGSDLNEVDERYIHWAIAQAMKNERELDKSVFEFLEKLLTGRPDRSDASDFLKRSAIRCAMKAQQLSGPVMAKGFEDTALYRYNRFIALNEVGSSPDQFGLSIAAFHKENQHRSQHWPHTLLATSTHDVKHGEDARARLAALSLIPEEWTAKVSAWSRILRARRADVEGTAPPARNDEYLFFQNLIATWPAELSAPLPLEPKQLAQYSERLQGAMIKSVREARVHSNWISPDPTYEAAVTEFVRSALDPIVGQTFLENFLPFQQHVAELGVHNSLVQVLLKVTSPGVADFYQGSDLWDLNLPDPDNRRPVDFQVRRRLLSQIDEAPQDCVTSMQTMLKNWHDGKIKLCVTRRLLRFRSKHPDLFGKGGYEPLQTSTDSSSVCAFRRATEDQSFVALASLDARRKPNDYAHESLQVGAQGSISACQDVLTGRVIAAEQDALDLAEVFATLPIALLYPVCRE
jgi:(1->4)-alpha-D-glucan 1-alpha-D-glucosylmutase